MRFDDTFFDQSVDRRNTDCEKWDDREMLPSDGIPLWVADMDFPCAPAILNALRKRAEHPCFGYNIQNKDDENTLIAFWQRRHDLQILQGQTLMLPCVITGLKAAVRAFTKEGDGVAIFTPVYGPFYSAIQENGRQVMGVSLLMDDRHRYHMDLAGMEKALQNGARLIMLCNPHNPVSRLWTLEELTRLCRLAEQYNVPIVSDEIHADFVYKPGKFISVLSVREAQNQAVMLCSASKTFNIAGLQQACAVSYSEKMLAKLNKELSAAGVTCGNTFALLATRAAYTDCDDWLDGLTAYLDGSRSLLSELIAREVPKAIMTPVEATYLGWLDLRPYGYSCVELKKRFWDHGVSLTAGSFFGAEGEGFMRVNFACPRDRLKEGIKRLGAALKEE